jgi:hypothetical protein
LLVVSYRHCHRPSRTVLRYSAIAAARYGHSPGSFPTPRRFLYDRPKNNDRASRSNSLAVPLVVGFSTASKLWGAARSSPVTNIRSLIPHPIFFIALDIPFKLISCKDFLLLPLHLHSPRHHGKQKDFTTRSQRLENTLMSTDHKTGGPKSTLIATINTSTAS